MQTLWKIERFGFRFISYPATNLKAPTQTLTSIASFAGPTVRLRRLCVVTIEKKDRPFGLHQLGITAHVYVDTWAHQRFAGIPHAVNFAKDIELVPGETLGFNSRLTSAFKKEGIRSGIRMLWNLTQPLVIKAVAPLGHGMVLHYPDHPFRKWRCRNGLDEPVDRDNTVLFLEAAENLCRLIRRYKIGDPNAEVVGLPANDKAEIEMLFRSETDDDSDIRLKAWKTAIADGRFSFGSATLVYELEGNASWKFASLGIAGQEISDKDRYEYSDAFLSSNWKMFHDAAQTHQRELLHEILPSFGICAL